MATLVNGKGTDVPKSMSAARDTGCKLFNYEAAASEVTAVQLTVGDKPYRVVDLDDGTALLQLDIEVSWSIVFKVLKIVSQQS